MPSDAVAVNTTENTPAAARPAVKILSKLLDRLFASLTSGPGLNCRPHSSRQRIDLAAVTKLQDLTPEDTLLTLLGPERAVKLTARAALPKRVAKKVKEQHDPAPQQDDQPAATPSISPTQAVEAAADLELTEAERRAQQAWLDQQSLLNKLRIIADDARTYEQDTGVHVLHIGFPLLALPPGSFGDSSSRATRRILAPIAFIPVTLSVNRGPKPSVHIACRGEGIDLITPNTALLAWLEQQTGQPAPDLFSDEEGEDPWREIIDLVRHVAALTGTSVPDSFNPPAPPPPEAPAENAAVSPDAAPSTQHLALSPTPRADDLDALPPSILPAAVIGLFPMANQGLLRDMQSLHADAAEGLPLPAPVQPFVQRDATLAQPAPPDSPADQPTHRRPRAFADERLVSLADPCQSRAVKLARSTGGLVIHGPPGTGKSQTITNVIGDHLARGQRVLLVCDKRTALDVVANRLDHLGLSQLLALVHDPQRDQRDLYKSIRQQLDDLPDAKTSAAAESQLAKLDAELQQLHAELTDVRSALMESGPDHQPCFHNLVGQWLSLPADNAPDLDEKGIAEITPDLLDRHAHALHETLTRGAAVGYGSPPPLPPGEGGGEGTSPTSNPWPRAAGISLTDFLSRPLEPYRQALLSCVAAGRSADATFDPAIPPFLPDLDLTTQSRARTALADDLQRLLDTTDQSTRTRWAAAPPDDLRRARQKLSDAGPFLASLQTPLDPELSLAIRSNPPSPTAVSEQLTALAAYLSIATTWHAFFHFKQRSAAARVTSRYGLPLSPDAARRAHSFLTGLRARLVLQDTLDLLRGTGGPTVLSQKERDHRPASPASESATGACLICDEDLQKTLTAHTAVLDMLLKVHSDPALVALAPTVTESLASPAAAAPFLHGLRASAPRATALVTLESSLAATKLLDPAWLVDFNGARRANSPAGPTVTALSDRLDTLEPILRIRQTLAQFPPPLRTIAEQLLAQSLPPDAAIAALRRSVLAAEIQRRLSSDPRLQSADAHRLRSAFDRYRTLESQKRTLVRDAILHLWTTRQKQRLLATTGSRLNSSGADLKRRLTTRGERATRLRQVIAMGARNPSPSPGNPGEGRGEGDSEFSESRTLNPEPSPDPLFDLRPVWLASPETVAQIFPRQALFDAVIFDEASQCRLEEALPVLARGRRVVVAGDPKQLPPTRFFESSIAQSEDEEAETDQDLFEAQQSEVEDLLGAALNLEIDQSYLDVHYRSRNADLIEFSNRHFYNARLQPIPAHPNNRTRYAPLTLYAVNGTYAKRANEAEADQVVKIVRDLLKRADPPSIGIACFNLPQRDLIAEKLDDAAMEDPDFGKRLAAARTRTGPASFEGLFVKNLENVQGDERDHVIISTTYGPEESGKFYRRFGPLGRAGGARRLNVLVTRAREEVHLVTSIPRSAYRSLPPVPPDQSPAGPYLLFSYLAYAEHLRDAYARPDTEASAQDAAHAAQSSALPVILPTRTPSPFAESLANVLATSGVPSTVHWGNDGFSIDLALRHPARPDEVTIGLLTDATRYPLAEDPVEWDVFRTAVHESQGWQLHRLWTPQFFRDPQGCIATILKSHVQSVAASDAEKDTLRTQST